MLTPFHLDAAKAEVAYRNEIATRPALLSLRKNGRRNGGGRDRRSHTPERSHIVPLPERPFWAYAAPRLAPSLPTDKGPGTPAKPAA